MPTFFFELPQGMFYGFPAVDELGVKLAEHSGGRIVGDPLTVDREIDSAEEEKLREFLASCMPGVSSQRTGHAVCMYTMSADENFIVDKHPADARIVFAAGLSGHGFKFTPALGEAVVELAMDGATKLPVDFLALNRFTSGG
jgi:glycine/D-amino acid oxidase-like deaminating enzyme